MKKTAIASTILFALPFIASAEALGNIRAIIDSIRGIVNVLIPIAIAATVLVFFYGLFKYVQGAGKGHKEGKNIMIAGIIAIFIEVSLWGVIGFVQNALIPGGSSANISVPQI